MGVLYMLLSLAVMVPLAFLTEAVMGRLSADLRSDANDVVAGIARRRVEQALLLEGFLGQDASPTACQDAAALGVVELLEGDSELDRNKKGKNVDHRYFFWPDQPNPDPDMPQPGFLVKLPQNSPTEFGVLNELTGSRRQTLECNPGYTSPLSSFPVMPRIALCRIRDRAQLLRVNADWRWSWADEPADPPTDVESQLCDEGLLIERKA